MSNIRTITEEFAVSGSLKNPEQKLTATEMDETFQETVIFLTRKVNELITEVNILKNQ